MKKLMMMFMVMTLFFLVGGNTSFAAKKESVFKKFESDAYYYDKKVNKFETKSYKINSEKDMSTAIQDLFTKLPKRAEFTSSKYSYKVLKELYENELSKFSPEELAAIHSLANYSFEKNKIKLIVKDNTNPKFSAQAIAYAFNNFTDTLAKELKKESEEETVYAVYDFIFDNFKYNANGFQTMLVGNIYNQTIACNGFSYLADNIFEKVGITSTMRAGESHYWTILTIDGKEVTFDVTSDILLKARYKTLGTSTDEHKSIVSSIGFYNANFDFNKYKVVDKYNIVKQLLFK